MADAAVTFLLENLKQLLKSYFNLISGAENELKQLKEDLDSLKGLLAKAEDMTNKDPDFLVLEKQIREAVYDAEDTIDKCLITLRMEPAAPPKPRRFGFRKSHDGVKNTVGLAKEVKSVMDDQVKPMLKKATDYFAKMGEGSGKKAEESWTKMRKVQLIRSEKIVGFKDEEETIMKYLNEETEELDVISIIGMPGLGKTTLAWKIYQNTDIRYDFPTRIWVYVSQEFNARDVFLNILKKLTDEDKSSLSDQDLATEVRTCLEDITFLLVMDDVWIVEAWKAIKHALLEKNRKGKVLITSRERKVGTHANVRRKPHELRFLTQKESWELLQLEVFGNLEGCPEQLKTIGEVIAQQCDGLPLAIVVIGGILVDQFSMMREMIAIQNAWTEVSKNVSMHVTKDKGKHMSDIVDLSYKKLPRDLRNCFLYLGVFPEDYEIPAWKLTRLWIAEGFVQHNGKSLEEVAEENLEDLINRNLVMPGKVKADGKVKTCRVHDVIREFCNSKASLAEQNLFQEIKKFKQGVFEPPVSDIHKCRRLCIHFHLPEFLKKCKGLSEQQAKRIRSFLCFYKESILLDPNHVSIIPDTFNLLRILDSQSIKFPELPTKYTKLIHLRYLTLSCDGLKVLPDAITKLWNLQTLMLDTKERTLEIKGSIWNMIQLRHFKTKAEIMLATDMQGEGGENLQTLSTLSSRSCTQAVFEKARNLKRLGIRGNLATVLKSMSMEMLECLDNLKLVNDLFYGSASDDPLRGLPPHTCFPPSIKTLTLSATFLDWKHMSTLGMISTLQVLKLKYNAFKGISWQVVDGGFRHLQFLLIQTADLRIWEASDHHFPSLRYLVLKNCRDLCKIPLGLAKNLQVLDIERVSKSAAESAREIEEEKKRMLEQQKAIWGTEFKLCVGPGCE